jgi:hypothetical protein
VHHAASLVILYGQMFECSKASNWQHFGGPEMSSGTTAMKKHKTKWSLLKQS